MVQNKKKFNKNDGKEWKLSFPAFHSADFFNKQTEKKMTNARQMAEELQLQRTKGNISP